MKHHNPTNAKAIPPRPRSSWPWRGIHVLVNTNDDVAYAQQYPSERLLGYLCTTWNAVQPGEIAPWPSLQLAMQKSGSSGRSIGG